jgi:hypothetical protein
VVPRERERKIDRERGRSRQTNRRKMRERLIKIQWDKQNENE